MNEIKKPLDNPRSPVRFFERKHAAKNFDPQVSGQSGKTHESTGVEHYGSYPSTPVYGTCMRRTSTVVRAQGWRMMIVFAEPLGSPSHRQDHHGPHQLDRQQSNPELGAKKGLSIEGPPTHI